MLSHRKETRKQQTKQFRTLDLIVLVVLCGSVSTLTGALLAHSLEDNRPHRAKSGAEALAYQLNHKGESLHSSLTETSASSGGRAPASASISTRLTEGDIGKDPWGRRFHYALKSAPGASKRLVIVWSDGPDGVSQTDPNELSSAQPSAFRGDDTGVVQEFATHF